MIILFGDGRHITCGDHASHAMLKTWQEYNTSYRSKLSSTLLSFPGITVHSMILRQLVKYMGIRHTFISYRLYRTPTNSTATQLHTAHTNSHVYATNGTYRLYRTPTNSTATQLHTAHTNSHVYATNGTYGLLCFLLCTRTMQDKDSIPFQMTC